MSGHCILKLDFSKSEDDRENQGADSTCAIPCPEQFNPTHLYCGGIEMGVVHHHFKLIINYVYYFIMCDIHSSEINNISNEYWHLFYL